MKIFCLILTIFYGCSQDTSISKDLNINIKAYQSLLIEKGIAASNVVVLFKDGKEIVNSVVNSKNKGDMNINDNTIFPIWSLSKTVTGIGAMILYEKGLINFEDPLSKYIPYFKNIKCKDKNKENTYYCENQITILDLMTHRSGYRNNIDTYPTLIQLPEYY